MSRLPVTEAPASLDVLCSDEIVALIQNSVTLGDLFAVERVCAEDVVLADARASPAEGRDRGHSARSFARSEG